ncbi:hypothetical protein EVAR_93330_1 [Eumeta japonica]|uniref:Uncharacterized protein n=2 Tax=Eumeta variegata TaxID=151549 RepID=A0A4C1UST2_EUMVA|nr:hypothetical protein EVAR_93330_1 [Eumeta japonica]
MERDIFGRLLAIAIKQKVNIGYCLSFPLAPIPPALFSCSGDMLKTDKSTLSKQLTSQIDSENPDKVDIEIIDGFYYMYQIGATLPQTFGKLAELILIKLCAKKAKEVHIVFDRYLKPSIKDCERQNREDDDKIETVQEFTCLMYGIPKCQSVNEGRFIMFNKMYGSKNTNEKFIKNIKGFDSTHILPCWESLKQKILRTIYVNSMWLNATEPNCIQFSAENNGWLIFDGSLKPTWFLGNATPLEVENIILGDSQDDSADNEEDSDVCSDEVDSSDDSESSLESDYE